MTYQEKSTKIKEIQAWLMAPQPEWREGISLLERYGNRRLARVMAQHSPRFYLSKLRYELARLISASPSEQLKEIEKEKAEVRVDKVLIAEATAKVKSYFTRLSMYHNSLYEISGNDEVAIKKRKAILDERKPLIKEYNALYEALHNYRVNNQDEEVLRQLTQENEEPEEPKEKPSLLELKLIAHRLRTNITRRENFLLYQQKSRQEIANPLPQCPRRTQIENELKDLYNQLNEVKRQMEDEH